MRTREEVEKLKNDWKHDPCWDIESTESFEEYHDELKIFSLENKLKWTTARLTKHENTIEVLKQIFRY